MTLTASPQQSEDVPWTSHSIQTSAACELQGLSVQLTETFTWILGDHWVFWWALCRDNIWGAGGSSSMALDLCVPSSLCRRSTDGGFQTSLLKPFTYSLWLSLCWDESKAGPLWDSVGAPPISNAAVLLPTLRGMCGILVSSPKEIRDWITCLKYILVFDVT